VPVQAKGKLKKKSRPIAKGKSKSKFKKASWMAVGIDTSTTALAAAAFAYDGTLKKEIGPVATVHRFSPDVDWFDRLKFAVRPENLIHDLMAQLKIIVELEETYIGIEQPFAYGQIRGGMSNALMQQAQISGAVYGGLLRYGYFQLHEMSANDWRQIVAAELGITIHHSKWNNPKGVGKLRAREYVEKVYPEVPAWPDLISRTGKGLIPRPEDSKAKAVQCDDRYQAICQADWMVMEIEDPNGTI
jgi:hypothetical protein